MSELVACPKCGLSQSARHAFCARCDFSFDDPTPSAASATPAPPPHVVLNAAPPGADAGFEDSEPTVEDPPAPSPDDGGRRSDRSLPRVDIKRTQPALPPDTVEEALPDAPTWSMPGRSLEAAAPGRGWGENTGKLARRTPGLGHDRGSLTRGRRDSSGGLPAAPAAEESPATPSAPPPRSHPGRPGSELRGRPPGGLYADEQSSPPGDPLMAALVSGDEHRAPPLGDIASGRPPVHPLYPEGLPSESDFAGVQDSLSEPSEFTPTGPRVVPPSTGRRGSSVGSRRRSASARDPRGRVVASTPGAGIQPDISRPADLGAVRDPVPEPVATAPPPRSPVEVPLSQPGPPIPVPPAPPAVPENFRRDRPAGKKIVGGLAAVGLVVVLLAAGLDAYRMFDHLGSLNAVLEGTQATPVMPRALDAAVIRLHLEGDVQRRWARIRGENDTFQIGVEVRHRIVGVPVVYSAEREGRFRLASQLPTLSYFVDGGWQLDEAAHNQLVDYTSGRQASPPQ